MTKNPIKSDQSSVRTASRMVSYFFRRGNKEGMESLRRQVVTRRAKQQKNAGNPSTSALFGSFFHVATPFIALKTRRLRRGKRVLVKLSPLNRIQGERKSMISLSSNLQVDGVAVKPFGVRLERELETLFHSNQIQITSRSNFTNIKQKLIKGTTTQTAPSVSSQIRDKRDEVHQLAYKSRPYGWGLSLPKRK